MFGIENGVSNQLIGFQQTFILNPAAYSFDIDDLILPTSLKFKFFCTTVPLNTVANNINVDLKTFKNDSQLIMTRNKTCFESNRRILLVRMFIFNNYIVKFFNLRGIFFR